MRFRAKNTWDSAQGYIQCMKCIGSPCGADGETHGRTYVRTYGRSRDYYVTTKISWLDRLPNFLSNGAPLTRDAFKFALSVLFELGWHTA